MKLYGTRTSPFVRRVRVVAAEVGEPLTLCDTATDEGQAALRAVSPIAKVPVGEVQGRTIFDSRSLIDWLTLTRGFGALSPPRDRFRDANLINAIDGALESAVQVFYLRRDGMDVSGLPFAKRQLERVAAIFEWLAGQLREDGASFDGGLGLPELSLVCTLDWMDFRDSYPTGLHPALTPLRAAYAERPSLVATRPVL